MPIGFADRQKFRTAAGTKWRIKGIQAERRMESEADRSGSLCKKILKGIYRMRHMRKKISAVGLLQVLKKCLSV